MTFAAIMLATNVFNNALESLHGPTCWSHFDGEASGMGAFDGKVVLVTGAAHGQGPATALAFRARGGADRRPSTSQRPSGLSRSPMSAPRMISRRWPMKCGNLGAKR